MGSKGTNFHLSDDELSLLSDPSFFIRKKLVTNRIVELFGALESEYHSIGQKHSGVVPGAALLKRGKISKGENYKGFPYIMLDHPAVFEKQGVFAYRTLMWWGHAFSFTFHLSGIYFERHINKLFHNLVNLDGNSLICINAGQWEHHHEYTNYIPLVQFLSGKENNIDYFNQKGFIKLSKSVPLEHHPHLFESGCSFLEEILEQLK